MTNLEMLQAYRAAVIDLQELAIQLDRSGTSGRPQGIHGIRMDAVRGTNDPVAAALQASDGLEEMIDRKRSELADLAVPVGLLLSRIGNSRTYMVIQNYYLQAATDADIARKLRMSRGRINQIRNEYIAKVG